MARIIKKKTRLDTAYKRSRCMTGSLYSLAALCGIVCLTGTVGIWPPMILAGAFVFLGTGVFAARRNEVIRTGIDGENATAALIARLPKDYCGFQNVTVSYQGKTSEMDMVVAGPTGVFIIETKNHNGNIRGSYESAQWTQHKTGRAGGAYSKALYSPVKQVGTHVYRLAHYLRSHGCNVHVEAMVFFTNPLVTVRLTGTPGDVAVYAGQPGAKRLTRKILSAPKTLTPQMVENICCLLKRC